MIFEVTGVIIETPTVREWNGANGPGGIATVVIEYYEDQHKHQLALENKKNYLQFAKLQNGQTVKVRYTVSSRNYNNRWYTSANCISWEVQGAVPASSRSVASEDAPF